MINTKIELKRVIKLEKSKYKLNKFYWILTILNVSERGRIWKYQRTLRKAEYHYNTSHKLRSAFYLFKLRRQQNKLGITIPINCVDEGLMIMHTGRILMNSYTRIGKNCCLHCNTYFVATSGTNDSPTLGDNCKIGVGSILIGGIKLADGIAIGAGSIVTKSFDENNITIAGNPAKKISNKGLL